mmetsp:Transcript_14507/g.41697  ORF Transcript_14507/g.41697 Transcript_14507/m.41697 type:complete len:334 (+) Transcript_14507:208-1209(+)
MRKLLGRAAMQRIRLLPRRALLLKRSPLLLQDLDGLPPVRLVVLLDLGAPSALVEAEPCEVLVVGLPHLLGSVQLAPEVVQARFRLAPARHVQLNFTRSVPQFLLQALDLDLECVAPAEYIGSLEEAEWEAARGHEDRTCPILVALRLQHALLPAILQLLRTAANLNPASARCTSRWVGQQQSGKNDGGQRLRAVARLRRHQQPRMQHDEPDENDGAQGAVSIPLVNGPPAGVVPEDFVQAPSGHRGEIRSPREGDVGAEPHVPAPGADEDEGHRFQSHELERHIEEPARTRTLADPVYLEAIGTQSALASVPTCNLRRRTARPRQEALQAGE